MRHFIRLLISLLALGVFCLFAAASEPTEEQLYTEQENWLRFMIVINEDGFTEITRTCSDGSAECVGCYQQRVGPCEYVYVIDPSLRTERIALTADPKQPSSVQEETAPPQEVISLTVKLLAQHFSGRPNAAETLDTRSNTVTYYSDDDRPLWSVRISGDFCGDRCCNADGSITVYDSAWVNEGIYFDRASDGAASEQCRAHCLMTRKVLGIPVAKLDVQIWIEADGRCIVTVENCLSS